jgi:hypothetical protein
VAEITSEMGFTPAEALLALRQTFGREGWRCAEERWGDEAATFRAEGPEGAAIRVEIRSLPDRRLGPTIRLPRSSVHVEIHAGAEDRSRIEQIVRLSLHRGGG